MDLHKDKSESLCKDTSSQSYDNCSDSVAHNSRDQSDDSFPVQSNDASDKSDCSETAYLSFLSDMNIEDDISCNAQGLREKLFSGCPISCQTSVILVMSLICHPKLTKRAAQDLIQLLLCHFPTDHHQSFTSLYTLKARFASLVGKTPNGSRKIKYCTQCHSFLSNEDLCITCTNVENTLVGEFTELDIQQQIQQLFRSIYLHHYYILH